jgi:3-hydroxybutyryl-CoA dehydrogenase
MSTVDLRPAEWPVLIVGAGRMGLAIGHIFSRAGFEVSFYEASHQARATIPERLRQLRALDRSAPASQAADVRIVEQLTDGAGTARLVIECALEKLELKQEIFATLDASTDASCILATNTSVIPVTAIAERVVRKERVVGTHFWNPPQLVKLVEVVQADGTSDATIATTMALMQRVGQLPVHVRKDVVGFIGNRMQHALKREAIALVQNGVCDAETVDFVIRNSFGPRLGIMGTLEQSDLVGLNLTLAIHEVILRDLDCSREPQKLLVDLVTAGKTGAVAGEGFRTYSAEQRDELLTRYERTL